MDGSAEAITTSGIFEEAGNTLMGFVNMTGDFFSAMWAHPMGKIVCTVGLVGGAIGLGYRLFFRKKHV